MKRTATDWHHEDIKAAVRKTGISLTALALANGLCKSAVRLTLIRPWPRVEAIIAQHLGLQPQKIWPSRYDARGLPLRGLHATDKQHRSAGRSLQHCQKEAVA